MSLNVFEIFAKIGLDTKEYDKGLNDSKSKLSGLGNSIKSGLATAAKVGLAATTAAIGVTTAAVAGLTKEAISSYKEYEQLEGGVKKLYGNMGLSVEEYAKIDNKSVSEVQGEWEKLGRAQDEVLKNAQNAYKTAGMSANQYMETATSFSASLIKSLGGDTMKAAEMTDVAMKAIADNYNTFGGDIGMIQGAFQGFAKQNYTMLDNLKLGYGGTKTEMEKLIKDANEFAKANGKAADLSIDSFADIVQAIQLIQEKQKIAGTTAREAMTTIEGSANATKAAWQDVLIAIGKGEGIESAFDGLTTALFGEEEGQGLLNLVIPRLQTVFDGISKFVDKAAPLLADKLPKFLDSVLPGVLKAGSSLIMNLSKGIVDALPLIANTVIQGVQESLPIIADLLRETAEKAKEIFANVDWKQLGSDIITFIGQGIELLADTIPPILKQVAETAKEWFESVDWAQVGTDILNFVSDALGKLSETVMGIISSVDWAKLGSDIITFISEGINSLGEIIPEAVQAIALKAKEWFEGVDWNGLATNVINFIKDGLTALIETVPAKMKEIATKAKEWFESIDWVSIGKHVIDFIINGLVAYYTNLPDKLREIGNEAAEWIKGIDWEQVGKDLVTYIITGLDLLFNDIPDKLGQIADYAVKKIMETDWVEVGMNIIKGIVEGVGKLGSALGGALVKAAKGGYEAIKDYEEINSPSKRMMWIGEMMDKGLAEGIKDNADLINKQIKDSYNFDDIIKNQQMNVSANISTNGGGAFSSGGMVQNLTINAPQELDPSEIARQTRNANRELMLQLRMA